MRTLAIFGLVAALVLTVGGSAAGAPATRTVSIIGRDTVVRNALFQSTFSFAPGLVILTRSGDTITWHNTTDAPHTVSVVDEDELPGTPAEVRSCSLCRQFLTAHGFPPIPPANPVLDNFAPATGAPVLNGRGDSLFVAPGADVTATIGSPAGAELYYMCAIHPWMQGEIKVLPQPGG